ncbi:MAG: D-glycero-beta-D-manno-heptose 1,7-bisphosphate 7-phosphatase [Gammaproteobacteria bacterium]
MPIIILDRDGVINQDSDEYIKSPREWQAIPGSLEAIKKLNDAGYDVCVATNQSGLGRGLFSIQTLDQIHQKMINELEAMGGVIRMIVYCPHHPDAKCTCRKPSTGLLTTINEEFRLDSDTSWMVGDTAKDVECAHRMGIRGALVRTGKGERELRKGVVSRETTPIFDDLAEFVAWLLSRV